MSYSRKTFDYLSKAIEGDQKARDILVSMHKELVAFSDAVRGNKEAHHWLYENGYYDLSSVLQAFNKNTEALSWLMKNKKEYAAFAGAVVGDDECYQWLANQGYYELADLSEKIKYVI